MTSNSSHFTPQNASVGRIYSILTGQPSPILLLGAGASVRSGIPLAGEMVERAGRWAFAREHGRSPEDPRLLRSDWFPWLTAQQWYNAHLPTFDNYPAAIQNLLQPRQARADFFHQLLQQDIRPKIGYEKLAEFLHQGYIKSVLTTNFDNCLSDIRAILRRPHHIDLIQTEADYTKFSTSPQYVQHVFLHGSVDHYTDRNLIDEVQRLDERLVAMVVPLLRDHPLIVVGYRGGEPSVMKHLLLDHAEACHNYRHGIFWCKLRGETAEALSPQVQDLYRAIGRNFSFVDIDGFDELFGRDLWQLHQDAEASPRTAVVASTKSAAPTFDMSEVDVVGLDSLDWPTARARILQYCSALQIKIPAEPSQPWFVEQLIAANLAVRDNKNIVRLTSAGCLLFSSEPQKLVPDAKIVVRINNEGVYSDISKDELISGNSSERVLEGNLWLQYNALNEVLTEINRPFRLKGELSETVLPYPPLALKEIIVNALVHRDYLISSPIVIEIGPASIRFLNPGGLVDEVQRRVEAGSIEEEIRRGHRGIKGYRNPVLADLFYGSGEMDKAGSGLSDMYKTVRANGGDVKFGPTQDNSAFEVIVMARPEAVDKLTGTATPLILNSSKYAANIMEVLGLPSGLYHAATELGSLKDIWKALPDEWLPPFLLLEGRIYSFHDLEAASNPLSRVVDANDVETLSLFEFLAGSNADGERRLVTLLNMSLEKHIRRIGMIVDTKKKRAYFARTEIGPRAITYQARLKKAKRTVVKSRISPRTGQVIYWEHESFGYRFEKFGESWGLIITPAYVFTFDGAKGLLASEKVNRLSTKRASRDYNGAVHNDLSFWTWCLSGGKAAFALDLELRRPLDRHEDTAEEDEDDDRWTDVLELQAQRDEKSDEPFVDMPKIILSSRLPTVTVNDMQLAPGELAATDDFDYVAELDAELEELAIQEREASEQPQIDEASD